MKSAIKRATCLALFALACVASASAQQTTATTATGEARPGEPHVPLAQAATAFDVAGREALQGRLRTQTLSGTPDAPVRNTRIVVENRSSYFYNYVAGWVTFYDGENVRCGEGLWKLEAFAPNEQVEVDTPGLRLTCTPATWRLTATTLLTRSGDVAKPAEGASPPAVEKTATPAASSDATTPATGTTTTSPTGATGASVVPPLEINVNGKTIHVQLGNPVEIVVGKERVRIVVQPAP